MRAWQAGIVVVAAAGNTGPDPMTIGVPGNVPYVITVGAMTDNYTPGTTASDDYLSLVLVRRPDRRGLRQARRWSRPGGHMLGLMPRDAQLASQHPDAR